MLALKDTIKHGGFDWLLWLDGDAIITNLATTLDEFVPAED